MDEDLVIEAYEALIVSLKTQIEEIETAHDTELLEEMNIRNILMHKIVEISSKEKLLEAAREIDELTKRPGDYVDLVESRDWD
jgi:hypothetical protein